MIFGESNSAVDDQGNRVLFGLTVEETRELLELTDELASARPGEPLSTNQWTRTEEMRWLELMDKHTAELSKLLLTRRH
jgi:hypothetical protein